MTKESPNSKLEDFRYDSKLFKQAYKAGLKLKKYEEKEKQKKTFIIIGSILSSILILFLLTILLRSPFLKSQSYVTANDRVETLKEIDVSNSISPISSTKEFDEEFVEANSALYANLNTGEFLYRKNIEEQVHIASITKLMTALVALREYELNEEVEVKKDWYAEESMSWSLGLDKGDKITVEALLNGMLISSYNDAAFALADHMEGGWEIYIEEMNEYAKVLGLNNTQFSNPAGLDEYGSNLSTAEELFRLSTVVYKNAFIMDTISKGYAEIEWDIGNEESYTTNVLMGKYGVIAGKTGNTEKAGGCFLGFTNDGMVTIVLGAEDRFDNTVKLLTEL